MTDDELRDAVASNRSWRGVLRAAGRTSPRYGRELRSRCDELGISYEHFRAGPPDDVIREAVAEAGTWSEAVAAAGYAEDSGSSRAQIRKRCALLGFSTEHLDQRTARHDGAAPAELLIQNLREAGAMLVAAYLTLAGRRVSWPLEPAAYDLLADGPDGIQRIQVKTTTRRTGNTWICSLTRSLYDSAAGYCVAGHYGVGEIDAFAVVDGDLSVYLIPFALLQGQATIHVSAWKEFRLRLPKLTASPSELSANL